MIEKFPQIKKDLKMFLSSEEAKITKKDAFRLGSGIMLTLSMATLFPKKALAVEDYSTTESVIDNSGETGRHISHGSHASHASHGSHGSHGSHASHGSHGQW